MIALGFKGVPQEQRVSRAKHQDRANKSTLPTCSGFKCLWKTNKCPDTNCTCKHFRTTQTRQCYLCYKVLIKYKRKKMTAGKIQVKKMHVFLCSFSGPSQMSGRKRSICINQKEKTEAVWRQRLILNCPLTWLDVWEKQLLMSECLVCYAVLWQQCLFSKSCLALIPSAAQQTYRVRHRL